MRNYPRYALVGLLLALLAGCQTGAQKKLMAMNVEAQNINTRALACYESVRRNQNFRKVGSKLYLNTNTAPTLRQMSDSEYPDKEQVEALHQLHQLSQPCRRIEIEAASKVHPLYAGYYANLFSQYDGVTLGLVNRSISWGAANRKLQEINAWKISEEANLRRIIDGELKQDHQAELAQRQRVARALSQWSYQQQALANQRALIATANAPRHTTTNCRWVGRNLNCSTF
ncbi:MAG: hypothetical protein ABJL64_20135 [Rhizobiaceae bacterium]